MELPLKNRQFAGQALARTLDKYRQRKDVIVLALPRGGVPVGVEIARSLDAELDLMLVRKLGTPWHRELAMGAIASGGIKVLNDDLIRSLKISQEAIRRVEEEERKELERREQTYRGDRPWPDLANRCVILVDDGLATGATMRAAIRGVRQSNPSCLVVAVPVAPPDTVAELREQVDDMVCLAEPEPFMAIGAWYQDFSQVSDEEVRHMLEMAWRE